LEGTDALSSSTVKHSLFTEEGGFWPWSDDPLFSRDEFLKDLRRVYVLYQRNGYFDAELESYSVRMDGEKVRASITVSEGEPTLVDSLAVEGLEPLDGADLVEEVRERIPLRQGQVFNEADLFASRDTLETAFRNRGYAYAQVLLEYRIDKPGRSASVVYTVDAGDRYYVGAVEVEGSRPQDRQLVIDQVNFRRGDPYSQQRILESRRNLYELGLFRQVQIEPRDEVRGDTLDLLVQVAPASTHAVRVGLGYATEDQLRVSASWIDRNFFGHAGQLEVRGGYSTLERELSLNYRRPAFILPPLVLQANAFLLDEVEDNYTVQRVGGSVSGNYLRGRRWTGFGSLTVERDEYFAFDAGVLIPELGREFVNPSRLLFLSSGVSYNTTDSAFQPTRGWIISLVYQIGIPALTGDYGFHRFVQQTSHYVEVREGWVLAARIRPGIIFGYGGEKDRVPLFQRLFAGGSNSVRGYQRRELGPKDDPDAFGQERAPEPVGGRGLLEGSAEIRFPIAGNLRGAAFVDAGNVWSDPNEISPGDLEYTPGAGLRYQTPVGPIRLDVARRMDGEESLPRYVFHISIGEAF
jgi:outer membrane protein insertion porin family